MGTPSSNENRDMSQAQLWSDDPADLDLLSFDAVASTVADALMDPVLDPVALALSGSWGSGKTTVLRLTKSELANRSNDDKKVLVIETDPWRYDPSAGAKESLISEILEELAKEINDSSPAEANVKSAAMELLGRLARRVDWARAIKLAAKTSLALQVPSVDEVVSLIKEPQRTGDEEGQSRTLDQFREEFGQLIESDALSHVQLVAVLVDDLDRCLPETVIETLETIRLFLAVDRMSFVIAADEDRVADAIAIRLRTPERPAAGDHGEHESPAQLYLHKIVQTTIPIPSLSRFDTQAFLLQLLLERALKREQRESLAAECADLRRSGNPLDSLEIAGISLDDELAIASRLTPLLYEKHQGNPRRLKRFLNDLRVRQSIAERRGITLDIAVVAKLMVLEKLLPEEFETLMTWLGSGTLRDQLVALETEAGKPPVAEKSEGDSEDGNDESGSSKAAFPEALVRWAKLPPPLSGIDLSPYLFLAAAFGGTTVLDESLPERLRDIAANLLSSSRVDQRAVEDADISALRASEPSELIKYLGRAIRDQPSRQQGGVTGILRVVRAHPAEASTAKRALLMLPADEVSIGTPLLVRPDDPGPIYEALEELSSGATPETKKAIQNAVKERS